MKKSSFTVKLKSDNWNSLEGLLILQRLLQQAKLNFKWTGSKTDLMEMIYGPTVLILLTTGTLKLKNLLKVMKFSSILNFPVFIILFLK